MKISTNVRVVTTVIYNDDEKYPWPNEAGKYFNVDTITFDGCTGIHLSGFAVRADGTEGSIRRNATLGWRAVKPSMREQIIGSRIEQLNHALSGEVIR